MAQADACANDGAQKIVTGKVDWVDVFSDYFPVKGIFQKSLLVAFQASVDYDTKDGLQIVGVNKKWSEAGIDAFTSASADKVFGLFNKQLEKAFAKTGLKGEELNKVIGTIVKSQADFIENLLKSAISEKAKKALKEPEKK